MQQTTTVPATTLYLQKSPVNAPISGYITEVRIKPGDPVRKGDLLYTIESKEKKALGAWPNTTQTDTSLSTYGVFHLTAMSAGIITQMYQQQPGAFVSEGLPLCIIADPSTVLFQLNVPYEEIDQVARNPVCRIDLPDGSRLNARIIRPLTQVNPGSQAAPYLARVPGGRFFPEGLVATARLVTYEKQHAQLLPLNAVLSDELLHHFWIMQLINDSTAVKVPVTIGSKNDSLVEILTPALAPATRILTQGNYGLPDTALIKLIP
jgi:multidrug efflux pump subunit AcrA (membrane-fusion protein)